MMGTDYRTLLSAEEWIFTIVIGPADSYLGSETMWVRSWLDATMRNLAIFASVLCSIGAAAALFVVLVRIPALASTKLDLLLGTLQGVAVGLLFAITALLINLTYMVRREIRRLSFSSVGDGTNQSGRSGPGE
jgi:hypothetical protein